MMKLDIGCGTRKQAGFIGVDIEAFDGVDKVIDLRKKWPWKDGSVEEVYCAHFMEHLEFEDRCRVVNEVYRVLPDGGKFTLIAPYGLAERAYGDPTHKWPPVVGFWFYYLSRAWRDTQAPHTNKLLKCNFSATWGYSMHPEFTMKSQETQQFAAQWYVNAIQDLHATLIKLPWDQKV
jgi:hypothetical protein